MEQYIPKSALLAEIEKKIMQYEVAFNNPSFASYEASLIAKGKYRKLLDIRQFINTLEVKEVDLEKELIEWHKKHFKKDGTFIGMSGFYLTNNSQMDIAKHFFELGMQVSNKAQKGE